MISQSETIPRLQSLPVGLTADNSVEIEIDGGVIVFRLSRSAQARIENLLEKQRVLSLDAAEESELDSYEEIDDYLSFVNRLTRNLANSQNPERVS